MFAYPGHEMAVADSETEHEAIGEGLSDRLVTRRHRHWIARVDVGDPRRENQSLCGRQQNRRGHEGVTSHGLGDPEAAETQLFDQAGGLASLRTRERVDGAVPDSDATEIGCGAGHGAS